MLTVIPTTFLLLAAVLPAQAAAITAYGSPCPAASNPRLSAQGLPRLGTTFTVRTHADCLLGPPSGCGTFVVYFRRLIVGLTQQNSPFVHPLVRRGIGCPVLVSHDAALVPDTFGHAQINVPAAPAFLGFVFHVQGVKLTSSFSALSGTTWTMDFTDALRCIVGT